jgi:hypothetical protein
VENFIGHDTYRSPLLQNGVSMPQSHQKRTHFGEDLKEEEKNNFWLIPNIGTGCLKFFEGYFGQGSHVTTDLVYIIENSYKI